MGCESGFLYILIVCKAMLFKMYIRITWSACLKCKLLGPAPDLWKNNDLGSPIECTYSHVFVMLVYSSIEKM